MPVVRIFISSPKDVRPERLIARRVVERLDMEFSHWFHVEAVLWEREPLVASRHFQDAKNIPPPHSTDIVVVIVWSRLGVPLPADKFVGALSGRPVTGTEWEFEDALGSAYATGTPSLLFYQKTEEPSAGLGDRGALLEKMEQLDLIDDFMDRWFRTGDRKGALAASHSFATTAEFEDRVYEHLRALLQKRITRETEKNAVRWHEPPYRGLEPFEFEHAPVFFGRTRARNELRELLARQETRGSAFVLVLGASGSGKSSLVKAGLLPDLMLPGMIGQVALCRRAIMRPGDRDLFDSDPADLTLALASAIMKPAALPELAALRYTPHRLAQLLRDAPGQSIVPLEQGLAEAGKSAALTQIAEARLVVLIDQLEELFTIQALTDAERNSFVAAIAALARSGLVWVVATMRSDFFHRLDNSPGLSELANTDARYLLQPPDSTEIGQIIRRPAAEAGLVFEHDSGGGIGLDDLIEKEASDRGALPLLSFLLDQLWQRRTPERKLTFEAYRDLGGLKGALGRRATQVFDQQPPEIQAALPRVLRALVTMAPSSEGVATARTISENRFPQGSVERLLVDAFLDPKARLLVAEAGEGGNEPSLRVAHEALLTHWERAREQIALDRTDLELKSRLEHAAARWRAMANAAQRDSLLLATGLPLSEAQDFLGRRRDECDDTVVEYIERSLAAEEARVAGEKDREARERQREAEALRRETEVAKKSAQTFRRFAIVSVALLMLALAGGGFALLKRHEATEAQALAEKNYETTLESATQSFSVIQKSYNSKGVTRGVAESILNVARNTLSKLSTERQNPQAARAQMQVYATLIKNYVDVGDTDTAQGVALAFNQLAEQWANTDPKSEIWQDGLALSFDRMGDARYAGGDVAGALTAYQRSAEISGNLAKVSPTDDERQHTYWRSLETVGDMQKWAGNLTLALETFRAAERIALKVKGVQSPTHDWLRDITGLGDGDQDKETVERNRGWQRDLNTLQERIGDVLLAEGDVAAALGPFSAVLDTYDKLASFDDDNTDWKWGLMVARERMGDAMRASGKLDDSLRYYDGYREIAARLAKGDETNDTWKRELGLSQQRRGDIFLLQGEIDQALSAYKDYRDLTAAPSDRDPNNGAMRNYLAIAHQKVGDAFLRQGDLTNAMKEYRAALAIAQKLAENDPHNAVWQRDLAVAHAHIAEALVALGDLGGALIEFRACEAVNVAEPVVDLGNLDPPHVILYCSQRDAAIGAQSVGTTSEALTKTK